MKTETETMNVADFTSEELKRACFVMGKLPKQWTVTVHDTCNAGHAPLQFGPLLLLQYPWLSNPLKLDLDTASKVEEALVVLEVDGDRCIVKKAPFYMNIELGSVAVLEKIREAA